MVNSSSEEGETVVNGMSYSGRDSENANSAIVVSIPVTDYPSEHPLAGIEYQRNLERCAYEAVAISGLEASIRVNIVLIQFFSCSSSRSEDGSFNALFTTDESCSGLLYLTFA